MGDDRRKGDSLGAAEQDERWEFGWGNGRGAPRHEFQHERPHRSADHGSHVQEQGSSHGNHDKWYGGCHINQHPEVRLRNRGTDPDPMPPDQDPSDTREESPSQQINAGMHKS